MADLITEIVSEEALQQISKLNEMLKQTVIEMDRAISTAAEFNKLYTGSVKDADAALKNYNNTAKKLNEISEQQKTLEKEKAEKLREIKEKIDKASIAYQRNSEQQRENIKISKALAREQLGLTGAYDKLRIKLENMRKEYKNVAAVYGENSKEAKKLLPNIEKLDKQIKKIDSNVREFQKNVGNYGSAFKAFGKIIAAAGITIGLSGIFQGFKKIIELSSEFNYNMSTVKAVTGATAGEFEALRSQAIELGSTTEKSASQVAQLQIELGKLGFTAKDIQLATSAILDFSTASGAELGFSASMVASTLKAYGESANQAAKYTDVMAQSFNASALDAESFQTGISIVSTTAAIAGKTIEETAAMMAILADRGMDASIAGTSLRNMFMETSKKGITLEDALNQIRNATDQTKTAFELFGERGATASIIIANNSDELMRMTTNLENSEGAASRMADIMRNNVRGDLSKAKAAIESTSIAIGDMTDGITRGAIRAFTKLLQTISGTRDRVKEAKTEFEIQNDILVQAETKVTALASRYEELKKQADPKNQQEMMQIISDIVEILPQAATKFDAYGNAIEISTEKINEAIIAQRLLTLELKGVTIDKAVDDITSLVNEYGKLEKSQIQNKRQLNFWEKAWFAISASQAKTSKDISSSMQLVEDGTDATTGELIKQNAQMKINSEKIRQYVSDLRSIGLTLSDVQALFADEDLTQIQKERINVIIEGVYREQTETERIAKIQKEIRKKSNEDLIKLETDKNEVISKLAKDEIGRREKLRIQEESRLQNTKDKIIDYQTDILKLKNELYNSGEALIIENTSIELALSEKKYKEELDQLKEKNKSTEELTKLHQLEIQKIQRDGFAKLQDFRQKNFESIVAYRIKEEEELQKQKNNFIETAQKATEGAQVWFNKFLQQKQKDFEEERKMLLMRLDGTNELINSFSSLGAAIASNIKDEKERIIVEQRVTEIQLALTQALAIASVLLDEGDPYLKAIRIAANLAVVVAGFVQAEAAISKAKTAAYAEGTDYHKGGAAIIGEGGQPELLKVGGVMTWITQPTFIPDLPVGASVTPLSDITQDKNNVEFWLEKIANERGSGVTVNVSERMLPTLIKEGKVIRFANKLIQARG